MERAKKTPADASAATPAAGLAAGMAATPDVQPAALSEADLEAMVVRVLPRILARRDVTDALFTQLANRVTEQLQESIDFNTEIIKSMERKIAEGREAARHDTERLFELREKQKQAKPDELQQRVSRLQAQVEAQVTDLEQAKRSNNILLFGVPEACKNPKEEVMKIITRIGVEIKAEDFLTVQRVGRGRDGKSRPILCRFVAEQKRMEVFRQKRGLKGQPFTIREDLTRERQAILRQAIKRFGVAAVWTAGGAILIAQGDKKHVVTTIEQLRKIAPGR